MKKLLVVDGNAVLHRAFHALPPLTGKKGPVGAVFGFFSILLRTVKEVGPDFLTICFDHPSPNFRHQQFIGYQSKRPKTDPSLVDQLKLAKRLTKKTGLPVFVKKGFEADDTIASLVAKASKRHLKTVVLTGDRDLMQLVSDKVKLLLPVRGLSQTKLIGPTEVKETLGVMPDQVIDYKALVGDSSDNYSGVPGIGPKTAVSLLNRYSSVKDVYRHLSQIDPRVKKKLIAGQLSSDLSYDLAKTVDNLDLKFDLKKATWNKEKLLLLAKVLESYRFNSLLKRLKKDFNFLADKNKSGKQLGLGI